MRIISDLGAVQSRFAEMAEEAKRREVEWRSLFNRRTWKALNRAYRQERRSAQKLMDDPARFRRRRRNAAGELEVLARQAGWLCRHRHVDGEQARQLLAALRDVRAGLGLRRPRRAT